MVGMDIERSLSLHRGGLLAQLVYCRRVAQFQTDEPIYVHPSWGSSRSSLLTPWQTDIVSDEWNSSLQQTFVFQRQSAALFWATLGPDSFIKMSEQIFLWLCRCDANLLISGKKLKLLTTYFSSSVIEQLTSLSPVDTHGFLKKDAFTLPLPPTLTLDIIQGFVYGALFSWLIDQFPLAFVHRISLRLPKEHVQNAFYKNMFEGWPVQFIEEQVDNLLLHICPGYAVVRGKNI